MHPLITPAVGQIIWGGLVFLVLLFLLKKFAWKPMLTAVNDREKVIAESIEMATKTKHEMQQMQAQNEKMLKEARVERDQMMKEATETSKKLVAEAREEAKAEANRIIADAQKTIQSEKAAALSELKTTVASLSLEIAEKVIKGEMTSDAKQKALAEKLAEDINVN
ncbi:F0F1 ATP synthase subunit B [Paracrocinitomix mangrovi]|uniref:F0F1 ATP synthase subunit B n=1 Tax=Paracrocinitomix mangrovi TaxID=2862509 RepID=UPI001C8D35A1|nr:F0F1 ATP synthase subunit B [Paracrocinitomix mangrovi]UKN00365.1 F0F1 ATP synthase subunit B [Paracrocinitomix mangrovi]